MSAEFDRDCAFSDMARVRRLYAIKPALATTISASATAQATISRTGLKIFSAGVAVPLR